mgnify:CR=1 FL=1
MIIEKDSAVTIRLSVVDGKGKVLESGKTPVATYTATIISYQKSKKRCKVRKLVLN